MATSEYTENVSSEHEILGTEEAAHESAEGGMEPISIKAEELFHIGDFAVTNSMALGLVTSILLITLGRLVQVHLRTIPGKLQGVAEIVFEGILSTMDPVLGDRKRSERYLPLVATIFLFVLFSNWLGLFPITGPLKFGHHPLFRAPTSDLNFTIALAVIAVFLIHLFSAVALGFKKHAGKFFNFSDPIHFFVGLLEVVSEFVKIVSFSFRLFGNVFAGEVLLIIVSFLAPYFVPLPFMLLEVFVGFIQAFIFAMLTTVFLAMNSEEHGGEEHAH
ncbi:MAG: F0F1 ATP synthase subunit A [Patescibacteria group bacterium]